MAREIKFRAWYTPFKYTKFGQEYRYGEGLIAFHNMAPDKYELEQFTGMRDNNGVDVYEGDIVRVADYEGDLEAYSDLAIAYEAPGFYLEDANYVDLFDLVDGTGSFDGYVIGNIHENPELLEVN